MLTFSDNENSKKFECKNCNFVCSKKFEWSRHINTLKHTKMLTNVDKKVQNVDIKSAKSAKKCQCSCGKVFMHRQSLSLHRKKYNCETSDYDEFDIQTADLNDKELISYLMKENSEFKSMLLEQNKMMMNIVQNSHSSISNTINQTNQTNSHNKTFNLQFFLNETCKDAMNISEFIDNIKLQLSDLENIGKLGYVEGISNIIKNYETNNIDKN
jgi:hypothetical protein